MNPDTAVSGRLAAWSRGVRRRSRMVLLACAVVTLAALVCAGSMLGIDSNTIELFPEDLPARRNHDAFVALFPDLENALFVVIDGETPDLSRDASDRLQMLLAGDTTHFADVYVPGGGPFFERNALLYRSIDDLDRFADNFALIQPVVAELKRDGSLGNLASLIRLGLENVETDLSDPEVWSVVLDRFSDASVEVYEEHPLGVSWQDLMLRGSAIESVTRRILIAQPVLDFSDALPARAPIAAIRAALLQLELSPERGVRVRLTGNPALVHEETLGLVWDIGVSGVLTLLLVSAILGVALRSLPLVAGVVTTLLTGLVWTAGFAAIAVRDLNVISIAAGILFIGLGVDFGIHLAMRYGERLRDGDGRGPALDRAIGDVGAPLIVCAGTTAIGFFAFLPTDYQGVAELGLITGAGLLIGVFLTLTLFPALMSAVFRVDPARLSNRRLRFGDAPGRFVARHARALRWAFGLAAVASAAAIPSLRFDANIVAMRDPSTESVQTFNELLADAGASSPWFANSVAANLEQADALKQRMQELATVDRAVTLSDYIPDEQEEKLEILLDLSFMLSGSAQAEVANATAAGDQVSALSDLHDLLGKNLEAIASPRLRASMRDLQWKLGAFLDWVDQANDPQQALDRLDGVLLGTLPAQIARLELALEAEPIDADSLPPRLVQRMLAADGRARVQIFPAENLIDHAAFERFVDAVQSVDPQATGVSVNLVEFARTTQRAFVEAIATALLVISAILWLRWRSVGDALLVLIPLGLAALFTTAAMLAFGLSLNFFNVVVVPLLLGAGVDSAIHLVEQSRSSGDAHDDVLGTTTARAVFFSALTTVASFGTLAFSAHRGLAGLGTLLTIGMLLSVLCNLVLLPALLALRTQR